MAGERILPGLGLTGFWDLGSAYKTGMDTNLLALSALVQPYVLDAVAAAPGTPADGDIYLATAAWGGGAANDVMVRDNAAWVALTPGEGWMVYDRTANAFKVFDGAAWNVLSTGGGSGNAYYDIRAGFTTTPTSSQVLDTIMVGREITLPANLTGSLGQIGTNPTASFAISVKDDGTEIATVSIGTDGTFTFATTGGTAKTVSAGTVLTFVAPASADATAANATWTILATAA
jgi:hypothetical protein